MGLDGKDLAEIIEGLWPYLVALAEEKVQAPIVDELEIGRQVFPFRGRPAGLPVPPVPGDPLVVAIDLDAGMGGLGLYLFVPVLVGHAVKVFVVLEADMEVLPDGGPAVGTQFVRGGRQRGEQVLFVPGELLLQDGVPLRRGF